MSSTGPPTLVIRPVRVLLVTFIEAKAVLEHYRQFPSKKFRFENQSKRNQDHISYARSKNMDNHREAIDNIEPAHHSQRFPVKQIQMGLNLQSSTWSEYTKTTVGELLVEARQVLNDLAGTYTQYPSRQDPTDKRQYFGSNFRCLALLGVPVGYKMKHNTDLWPVVYAILNCHGKEQLFNSQFHMVEEAQTEFYFKALQLNYKKEIAFRRTVCDMLSVCMWMDPPIASPAEIEAAHNDMSKVPILVAELGQLGHLGVPQQERAKFMAARKVIYQRVKDSMQHFFNVVRGHECMFLGLLVRAITIADQLKKLSAKTADMITGSNSDRWIWLIMIESANLQTREITFRTMSDDQWQEWMKEETPVMEIRQGRDNFFLNLPRTIIPFELWDDFKQLCPLAAHNPFGPAVSPKEALRRGTLATSFTIDPDTSRVMHVLKPLWHTHHLQCMQDLFRGTGRDSRPPTVTQLPPTLFPVANNDPIYISLASLYMQHLSYYTDGRPEGGLYTIIAWLTELYNAALEANHSRFTKLCTMHDNWVSRGWITVTHTTTQLTSENVGHLRDVERIKKGEKPQNANMYMSLSYRKKVRQSYENSTEGQKEALKRAKSRKKQKKSKAVGQLAITSRDAATHDNHGAYPILDQTEQTDSYSSADDDVA